jgi:Neutral/alkaline non-lysosomal ceramidase, N-terminal
MSHLLAGVGRSDITPPPGIPQGGWGAAAHQRGLGVDMPLYATSLVLSDSHQTLAIIDIDSIGFNAEWTKRITDAVVSLTGLPREHIRLSATHTHSGPNTFRLSTITVGRDMAESYLESLPLRVAGAVWQAQHTMKPVRCGAGTGKCEMNVNRRLKLPDGQIVIGRNWEGPVDPTVRVIRFDDLDEKPVATITHYACHPTTMAWQCESVTPDYPGVLRATVERELGGTCLFLQGATGDVTPRRGFTGDLRVYRQLGLMLGLEAAKVAVGIETLPKDELYQGVLQSGAPIVLYEDRPTEPDPPILKIISRNLKLPARQFRSPVELQREADVAQAELGRLRRTGTEDEVRAATARATQASWRADYARQYHGQTDIDWPIQGIRIGSIALLSVAGEPFTEINREIVSNSPFAHTLFSGYSNGGFGYIPANTAFAEGGYEVEASPFSSEAPGILVSEAVLLLRELASAKE